MIQLIRKNYQIYLYDTIELKLKSKGYNLSKVYDPSFFAFIDTNEVIIKKVIINEIPTDTISNNDTSMSKNRHINKKPKQSVTKQEKISSCNNTSYNLMLYSEIFPLTNKKISLTDSINKKNLNVVIFIKFRGMNVSSGSQIASSVISAVATGILTGGAMVGVASPRSYTDISFYIIDRGNNKTLWFDQRMNQYSDPSSTYQLIADIKDILDDLPSRKINSNKQ